MTGLITQRALGRNGQLPGVVDTLISIEHVDPINESIPSFEY